MPNRRPSLLGIEVGASHRAWEGLGFTITDGRFRAGSVEVRIDEQGPRGMRAWSLSGSPGPMPGFSLSDTGTATQPADHANAVIGVDHVVITTGSLERTTEDLLAIGCEMRGERNGRIGGATVIQRFLPIGGALIELVSAPDMSPSALPSFWGLTFVSDDLSRLPSTLGEARPAVQPGRAIVAAPPEADLGTRVAFITPRQPEAA